MAGGWVPVPGLCNFVFGRETQRPSALAEVAQAGYSFSCRLDEKSRIAGLYEVPEMITPHCCPRLHRHVAYNPFDSDAEQSWCKNTALSHAGGRPILQ